MKTLLITFNIKLEACLDCFSLSLTCSLSLTHTQTHTHVLLLSLTFCFSVSDIITWVWLYLYGCWVHIVQLQQTGFCRPNWYLEIKNCKTLYTLQDGATNSSQLIFRQQRPRKTSWNEDTHWYLLLYKVFFIFLQIDSQVVEEKYILCKLKLCRKVTFYRRYYSLGFEWNKLRTYTIHSISQSIRRGHTIETGHPTVFLFTSSKKNHPTFIQIIICGLFCITETVNK